MGILDNIKGEGFERKEPVDELSSASKIAATTTVPAAPYGSKTPLPEDSSTFHTAFSIILDLAEATIVAGGDVHSVEVMTQRLGIAYGAYKMNVLVITTSIIVTATLDDGREITQTRRIEDPADNDFEKLESYVRLARSCIRKPLDPDELQRQMYAIKRKGFSKVKLMMGGLLATSSFAIFFGGTWLDAAVSAVFSIIICLMMIYIRPIASNTIVFDFLASLISGIGICLVAYVLPEMSVAMVMVGDIMILIPGVAMTSAIRDMIFGDTVSGTMRLMESLLWASSLALGFMGAMYLLGIPGEDLSTVASPPVQLGAAIFGSLGFALFFNVRNQLIWLCTLIGFLTEGFYLLFGTSGLGIVQGDFLCAVAASVFAAAMAQALSRALQVPTTVFFIIAVIPLVPGRGLYFTMQTAVSGAWDACSAFALSTFQTALGIAIGIVIVEVLVQIIEKLRARLNS